MLICNDSQALQPSNFLYIYTICNSCQNNISLQKHEYSDACGLYKYLLSLKIEPLVRVTLVVPCNNV